MNPEDNLTTHEGNLLGAEDIRRDNRRDFAESCLKPLAGLLFAHLT
jgi:hypothetical protein